MLSEDCEIVKIRFDFATNIRIDAVDKAVKAAAEATMVDVIVDIHHDTISGSPWLTGNNARSIASEVQGLQGQVFSTSGYGGFLETGHFTKSGSFVAARPYFKPALDLNFTPEKVSELIKKYLGA
jgi:hypothetical protein